MVSSEMSSYVASATGCSEVIAQAAIASLVKFLTIKLRQGEEVALEGLGKFFSKEMPARKARNPRTGEEVDVPAKTKGRFKYSGSFVRNIQSATPTTPAIPTTPTTPTLPAIPATLTRTLPPPPPPEMLQQKTWFISKAGEPNDFKEVTESELAGLAPNTPVWSDRTGWKLINQLPELDYLFPKAA